MLATQTKYATEAPRVALVHDHLVQDGGAERVLTVMMRMWPDAPLYTLVYEPEWVSDGFREADIRTSAWQRLPAARRNYQALLPFIDRAFRQFDLSAYDVVVSSASGLAKSVRTPARTIHICYCHTPPRYLWGDSESYLAELPFPRAVKTTVKVILPLLRTADLRGAGGVDEFVANSGHVAERIRRYYRREPTVIHPPVEIESFAPSRERKDYFLVAARLRPHKRVDLAIAAANQLGVPLKVVGSGDERARLEAMAGPTVEFTGRVSDAERKILFGSARAFLAPQKEDFGLTAVEALASGTPVIAHAEGGTAEIIEPGVTGLLFPHQSRESLVAAIRQFSKQSFDPDRLRRRATEYSDVVFERRFREFVHAAHSHRQAAVIR